MSYIYKRYYPNNFKNMVSLLRKSDIGAYIRVETINLLYKLAESMDAMTQFSTVLWLTILPKTNLTSHMKILYHPSKQDSLKPKRRTLQIYHRYAELVLSALQHSQFQRFLGWLLRYEHIPWQQIKAIHIRTLPHTKRNGRHLNGTATSRGVITLYPPATPTNLEDMASNQSKEFAREYVRWRARATLIHELLHYKYLHRERRVRKLTLRYTRHCMQPTTHMMKRVFAKIFRSKIHQTPQESP